MGTLINLEKLEDKINAKNTQSAHEYTLTLTIPFLMLGYPRRSAYTHRKTEISTKLAQQAAPVLFFSRPQRNFSKIYS